MNNERGATMLEFAISLGVVLMLIGGIVDISISMHRKSLLTHLSKEVSRLIAIRLVNTNDCDVIAETINNDGKYMAEHNLKVPISAWRVIWHDSVSANTYPSFNLSITAQPQCFFLCALFPNGLAPSSSIESTVTKQLTCPDVNL